MAPDRSAGLLASGAFADDCLDRHKQKQRDLARLTLHKTVCRAGDIITRTMCQAKARVHKPVTMGKVAPIPSPPINV
jgi:hypothetical protein